MWLMHTIYDKKKSLFLFCFFAALICCKNSFAQDEDNAKKKSGYSLVLYAGGGLSQYTAPLDPKIPGVTNKNLIKPIGTFRLMWQTDHRLSLGLESGFMNWYSYEIKHDTVSAKINVTSIPILATFGMPIGKRFKVFGGFGSYLMTSDLEDEANVSSTTLSLGWALAAAYIQPLKKDLSLAYEVKWCKAHETQDDALSLQVQLVWQFLKW